MTPRRNLFEIHGNTVTAITFRIFNRAYAVTKGVIGDIGIKYVDSGAHVVDFVRSRGLINRVICTLYVEKFNAY